MSLSTPIFNLAVTLTEERKYSQAETALRRAMAVSQNIGVDHPFSVECKKLMEKIEHAKAEALAPAAGNK